MSEYRIAVDTGGTFTDAVVIDAGGRLTSGKAPTTPTEPFRGVGVSLSHAAGQLGADLRELLAASSTFIYGTTRATNAIVTEATAATAFLTTRGFPDVLVLREGGKERPFDHRTPPPRPYVPKRLTFEIDERIAADGSVVRSLDHGQARSALARARDEGVEAVAVTLLWSVANPIHELELGVLIESELPDVPYTLSHQLNPIVREYRRASSTAIDASLKPLMQEHLRGVEHELRAAGFRGRTLVMTSMGGVLDVADVVAKPIYLVNSGPAMAPVAASAHASEDEGSAIVCDMGGTTIDVSVVRGRRLQFTRESWLGERFRGHMTGLASVDVKSIGAGGGSIAWIDPGGLLRVGPQSAGAEPGPACYSSGGDRPTVTDAAAAAGYLDPDYFLEGRLRLDVDAARRVIADQVAGPLGMSTDEAAHAILSVANEQMLSAIREITVYQGLDPRDCLIVAGGGAAGMTIVAVAEGLGCGRVLVPRTAATLSAAGGHHADLVTEYTGMLATDTARFDAAAANALLAELEARMDAYFDRLDVPPERRRREFFVDARYGYQAWELEVPIPTARFDGEESVDLLAEAFHSEHERVLGVREPGQVVECLLWKGRATATVEKPHFPAVSSNGERPAPRAVQRGYFAGGWADTPRYMGDAVGRHVLTGPVIVDEPGTTIVVPRGWQLSTTGRGDFMLTGARP